LVIPASVVLLILIERTAIGQSNLPTPSEPHIMITVVDVDRVRANSDGVARYTIYKLPRLRYQAILDLPGQSGRDRSQSTA